MLQLLAVDLPGGSTEWALADVRGNRPQGRAKLSNRLAKQRWVLPVASLRRVNLYLDM